MEPQPAPIYDANIPQFPSDGLATTQKQFLDNFEVLSSVFMANHISLESATTVGNHIMTQLLEQALPIQTDLGDICAYTKDITDQTDQLFLRYQGNGQEFQYTNYQLYFINPTTFFTFLPGRILVYFGNITVNQGTTAVLNLQPAIAKNIVSLSFVYNTTNTALGRPIATPLEPVGGFITGIAVSSGNPIIGLVPFNYVILANV